MGVEPNSINSYATMEVRKTEIANSEHSSVELSATVELTTITTEKEVEKASRRWMVVTVVTVYDSDCYFADVDSTY